MLQALVVGRIVCLMVALLRAAHAHASANCSDEASGSCDIRTGRSVLQVHASRSSVVSRAPPQSGTPDAEIRFTAKTHTSNTRTITDPWGVTAKRRLLKRRIWQKAFACYGDSQSSCKECVGRNNCFGPKTGGTESTATITSEGITKGIKRVQNLIHVRCSHGSLDIKLVIKKPRFGTLRAYWDGEEIKEGTNGISQHGDPFPVTSPREKYSFPTLNIQVTREGAHEFLLEWVSDMPNKTSSVSVPKLLFFMPEEFASCEDNKVCLDRLARVDGGVELRASNAMQYQCLSAASEDIDAGACRKWRDCLHNGSPSDDVNQLKNNLLELMTAAGVEPQPKSAKELQAITTADARHCIHPPTEDVESWECDCFAEMQRRCKQLPADVSTSEGLCLRAQFCSDNRTCADWKTSSCDEPIIGTIQDALRHQAVESSLSQRAHAEALDSKENTFDDTLRKKHCV